MFFCAAVTALTRAKNEIFVILQSASIYTEKINLIEPVSKMNSNHMQKVGLCARTIRTKETET